MCSHLMEFFADLYCWRRCLRVDGYLHQALNSISVSSDISIEGACDPYLLNLGFGPSLQRRFDLLCVLAMHSALKAMDWRAWRKMR